MNLSTHVVFFSEGDGGMLMWHYPGRTRWQSHIQIKVNNLLLIKLFSSLLLCFVFFEGKISTVYLPIISKTPETAAAWNRWLLLPCECVRKDISFSAFTPVCTHFSSADHVCLRSVSNCSTAAPHRRPVTGALIPFTHCLLWILHAAHSAD